MVTRCAWAADGDDLMRRYHDDEWGVPVHDDRVLFEFLLLEGAQAGLSWQTILRRRDGYRQAFCDFDAARVAEFDEDDVERLLADPGIIRNRLKVRAAIGNARAFLAIQEETGSFADYLWGNVRGEPIQNSWSGMSELPAETALSKETSKDLKRRGFKFVGPTIVYAYLQSVGLVNDHTTDCFRYPELRAQH